MKTPLTGIPEEFKAITELVIEDFRVVLDKRLSDLPDDESLSVGMTALATLLAGALCGIRSHDYDAAVSAARFIGEGLLDACNDTTLSDASPSEVS